MVLATHSSPWALAYSKDMYAEAAQASAETYASAPASDLYSLPLLSSACPSAINREPPSAGLLGELHL